ncbi:sodium-dependent lysophosphatidylcholine symporter 1-B-like [Xiphias gladius]|uniref:sodium-dependent lysophosphatidylcholine symporter 1-B-like n=1 Tax=Xiphias gladius TaxID=8245 RepID=UPI001A99D516|nr:sodium-dependent lysophosphatidylcholine symporter 1-B-like [Xiphias gladius]
MKVPGRGVRGGHTERRATRVFSVSRPLSPGAKKNNATDRKRKKKNNNKKNKQTNKNWLLYRLETAMARGEGAEQYAASLLSVKPINTEIKTAKPNDLKNRLSVWSKLCYAIGGAPYQITGSALGFFLQIYLLDVAQLDPFYASIILFVGRAWDAVTDPTVGFLVSRSRWTRVGRMMPWILFSTPFAVLTYFLIWYVPPFEQGKVIWYLIFYCLFQSMQTCFHVPYSALTMFISSDQKERDSATAYRMMVEVLGTVLGTAIQGQIVGGASDCPTELDVHNSGNSSRNNTSIVSLEDTKQAYLIASAVISLIYVLCAAILFFGVKEQKESRRKKSDPLTFRQGLWLVMSHGPYVQLVIGFLFTSLAFMLLEGNFALFITYALGHRKDFQNILLVIMLSGTLTIPWWQWFLTRFGKKTAVYFGISWAVPFMILIICIDSNLVVSYLVSVAAGVSVAAAFLLPWSMLPDVVDDFKVKNPHVHGHEALFYSFYVFFIKFASGISLGISTLSLKFAGYVTGSCSQPETVSFTLRMLVSPVPVCLIAVGLLILKTYPIDEERRQDNQKLLQEILDSETDSESETSALGSNV